MNILEAGLYAVIVLLILTACEPCGQQKLTEGWYCVSGVKELRVYYEPSKCSDDVCQVSTSWNKHINISKQKLKVCSK